MCATLGHGHPAILDALPLMRTPVLLEYQGPPNAHLLNVDLMAHVGGYSDISHLFFRDHLWQHPTPYLDFRFEYPVLTGLFVWVASLVHTSVAAYFLTSTGLLLILALIDAGGSAGSTAPIPGYSRPHRRWLSTGR